jgi:hypothetical protein
LLVDTLVPLVTDFLAKQTPIGSAQPVVQSV